MGNAFESSISGFGFVKSPTGLARNGKSGNLAQFQIIAGVCPIWGFGTFATDSTDLGLDYNITWPFVYQVQTETLVVPPDEHSSGNTYSRITTWQQAADVPFVVDDSAWTATWALFSGAPLAISSDGTVASYTYASGVTYTITLSAPFDGRVSANWAIRAATAMGLMGNATLPAILPYTGEQTIGNADDQSRIQTVVPVTSAVSSTGWAILDTDTFGALAGNLNLICAAANGIGVRLNDSTFNGSVDWPNLLLAGSIFGQPTVADEPYGPPVPDIGPMYANFGAVVCLSSLWRLNGQGLGDGGGLWPDTPHQIVTGQKFTPGATSLSAIIQPFAFNDSTHVSANGVLVPNPLYKWPLNVKFLATDVGANLYASGATTPFGILGFWPTLH